MTVGLVREVVMQFAAAFEIWHVDDKVPTRFFQTKCLAIWQFGYSPQRHRHQYTHMWIYLYIVVWTCICERFTFGLARFQGALANCCCQWARTHGRWKRTGSKIQNVCFLYTIKEHFQILNENKFHLHTVYASKRKANDLRTWPLHREKVCII